MLQIHKTYSLIYIFVNKNCENKKAKINAPEFYNLINLNLFDYYHYYDCFNDFRVREK